MNDQIAELTKRAEKAERELSDADKAISVWKDTVEVYKSMLKTQTTLLEAAESQIAQMREALEIIRNNANGAPERHTGFDVVKRISLGSACRSIIEAAISTSCGRGYIRIDDPVIEAMVEFIRSSIEYDPGLRMKSKSVMAAYEARKKKAGV